MDTSLDLSHLIPEVAKTALKEDYVRLRYIDDERFIPHARATKILDELERLIHSNDAVRAQGRMLIGPSLVGKSTIINAFKRRHLASDDPDGEAAYCPLITVQLPDNPREGIYPQILQALGRNITKSDRPVNLRSDCMTLLRSVRCKMIIMDEFHALLAGTDSDRTRGLATVKYLMNDLGRPVVVAGTVDCVMAIQGDDQMKSRLRLLPLRRFAFDDEFFELLVGFEAALPLRRASNLFEPVLAQKIYNLSSGVMGHLSDLLNECARVAIKTGEERITLELVDQVMWNADGDTSLKGLL